MKKINHNHRLLHLRWQFWTVIRHRNDRSFVGHWIVGQFVYPFFCWLCFLELLGNLLRLVSSRNINGWNRLWFFGLFKEVIIPRKTDSWSRRRRNMHVVRVRLILDRHLNIRHSLDNSYRW